MGAEEMDVGLRDEIREIVAVILEVDVGRIGPDQPFLGRARCRLPPGNRDPGRAGAPVSISS